MSRKDCDDLERAVQSAKGRPAVIVYTLVKPEWRDAMRPFAARRGCTTATCSATPSIGAARVRSGREHDARGRGPR